MSYTSASLLDVGLPLQVTRRTSAPAWVTAALLLVNTVLAVVLQVRASAGSETLAGAGRASRQAGLSLLVACLLFPLAALLLLVGACVALSGGELWSSAGIWGLSYALAPEERQAEFLAGFGLLQALPGVAGPAAAALIVAHGTGAWLLAGALFLLASVVAAHPAAKGVALG